MAVPGGYDGLANGIVGSVDADDARVIDRALGSAPTRETLRAAGASAAEQASAPGLN